MLGHAVTDNCPRHADLVHDVKSTDCQRQNVCVCVRACVCVCCILHIVLLESLLICTLCVSFC